MGADWFLDVCVQLFDDTLDLVAVIACGNGPSVVAGVGFLVAQELGTDGGGGQGLGEFAVAFQGILGGIQGAFVVAVGKIEGGNVIVGIGILAVQLDGIRKSWLCNF